MVLDAALQAQENVEVAQAHVGVDEHDLFAATRKRRPQIRRRRRLTDAAFARGQDDRATQTRSRLRSLALVFHGLCLVHALPRFQGVEETTEETRAVEVGK